MKAHAKKARGWLAQAWRRVVDDVEQSVDVAGLEAGAEVASGGGVGDASGAQGLKEVLVVASECDILQASAVTEGVVSDVEDVVGIVVGQVLLKQVQSLVDGVNESELSGQGVEGADTAVGDGAGPSSNLVVNVGGSEHWSGAAPEVGFVESALDSALAVIQPPS